jgi:hypothetical protein
MDVIKKKINFLKKKDKTNDMSQPKLNCEISQPES